MDLKNIKILEDKIRGLNSSINKRVKELNDIILEKELVEEDLSKLYNPGYSTQKDAQN